MQDQTRNQSAMGPEPGEYFPEAVPPAGRTAGVRSIRPGDVNPAAGNPAGPVVRPDEPQLSRAGLLHERPALVLGAWLAVVVALWLAMYLLGRDAPFQESHAWVSAHFSTIARSFVEHGVWELRFVPVQNNDPMGASPDYYTHWPPLFPALLSVLFAVLGESEAVLRGSMLAILLANAGALMWLVRSISTPLAATAAGLAMLCAPVLEQYALIGLPMHLAILGMLLGLVGFVNALRSEQVHRGWATFGIIALMLGCAASWEPVLATPGLFLIALIDRRKASIVLATVYGCAAALAVALVLGNYMLQLPDLTADLWDTVLVRIGLREYPTEQIDIHFIVNREEYATYAQPSPVELADTFGRRGLTLVGRLGLAALGWAIIAGWMSRGRAKSHGPAYAVAGLFSAWALWFILMNNHAYIHDFMMSLLVPAASVSVGLLAAAAHRAIAESSASLVLRRSILATLFVLAPGLLAVSLVRGVISRRSAEPAGPLVRYAQAIEANTDAGAVVLSTSPSMVPVFYSRRHVIRAVLNDDIAAEVIQQLASEFSGAPAYLAIEPRFADRFPQAISTHKQIATDSPDVILLRIDVEPALGNLVQSGS